MFEITNEIKKAAEKAGLELEVSYNWDKAGKYTSLEIYETGEDSEYWFIFKFDESDDSLYFKGFIYSPIEDIPYWVHTEAQLIDVLKFAGSELSSK